MIERLPRRGFLTGIAAVICAPAIVRAASLMPVKVIDPDAVFTHFSGYASIGSREDLETLIYRITPTRTPFFLSNSFQSSFQQPMRLG